MQPSSRRRATRLPDLRRVDRASSWLEGADGGRSGRVTVLTYHRVDEPQARPDLWPGLISADPRRFRKHVELLASRHVPISMSELLSARRDGRRLPRHAVLVTFDDAYCDFAENAWPTLKHYGVPTTLFVPTAYPDHPARTFWWDRLYAAVVGTRIPRLRTDGMGYSLSSEADRHAAFSALHRVVVDMPHAQAMSLLNSLISQLGEPKSAPAVLGWTELRALAAAGVTLAPHSRSHPRLDRIDEEELENEIRGSLDDLRERVPEAPAVFAYPSGAYDTATLDAVRRSGIEIAFGTQRRGIEVDRADWLRLPRINVGRRTHPTVLRAQLGSWMRLIGR